ncbi:hypothetical protein K491DRAFT_354908 [Lophiostoma macrostomum CBS 122681]|uniref:Jacalin-type lectin domain-containing protein n=1 Tax=Lophiostoma macrostomum CBS 122681 TaxID=1314788 RepID=A0A6A6TC90_9PLEO|nr:hypothetical protein K491DRAFT_354908 [Lophiostoma macrostomum CBS 122681]
MAIQLVPYNNAMRLGQGFNSYTQQICIDDAVVIDPERAENVITNDGTTMRILTEKTASPSVWNRQREVINDDRAGPTLNKEKLEHAVEEVEDIPADEGDGGTTVALETAPPAALMAHSSDSSEHFAAAEESPPIPGAFTLVQSTPSKLVTTSVEPKSEPKAEARADPKPQPAVPAPAIQKAEPVTRTTDSKATEGDVDAKGKSKPTFKAKPPPPSPEVLQRAARKLKAAEALKKKQDEQSEPGRKLEDEERRTREAKKIKEQREYQEKVEEEERQEELHRRQEERDEQKKIRQEKRDFEAKRREEARQAIQNAATKEATSLEELKKIAAQNKFADRFAGILDNQEQHTFDASQPRGPSQTVTYTSRFVDRLSDVTDDMCISGSLSIKAGKIGGSGKGSFVDSDKFKESDLNFYISVKVVNQTINFKDALVYNPVRSVDETDFAKVFGDSFISGFVEGGEFNALVSMKILNKAKKTDIQAEAKVALTTGSLDIEAQANVGIARSNLETNTETTIQVSWSGGGHIKPMEQQWDINSLMAAASRFPDLVADCPQRTYAILTKYDVLRSFVARRPEKYSKLQYENAQIYTNSLLDAFMSYKALYKQLGEQVFNVQGKTLEIRAWSDNASPITTQQATGGGTRTTAVAGTDAKKNKEGKDEETGMYPFTEDMTRFDASIKGLSDARIAIRRQMARIVNEVDLIEKEPKKATDEDHKEPFQAPLAFETRLPVVDIPERLKRRTNPLTGVAIQGKPLTEEEQRKILEEEEALGTAPALFGTNVSVTDEEKRSLEKLAGQRPGLGRNIRVTKAMGSELQGSFFNNLEVVLDDTWVVHTMQIQTYHGFICYIAVKYKSGLWIVRGVRHNDASKDLHFGPFNAGERVISASIETGVRTGDSEKRVLAIGLFTNRGRSFLATARTDADNDGKYNKDGTFYEKVEVAHFDGPLEHGTFLGFFGRSDDDKEGAIWRLGLVWGKSSTPDPTNAEGTPLGLSTVASLAVDTHAPAMGLWDSNVKPWKREDGFVIRDNLVFEPAYTEPPLLLSGFWKLVSHLPIRPGNRCR